MDVEERTAQPAMDKSTLVSRFFRRLRNWLSCLFSYNNLSVWLITLFLFLIACGVIFLGVEGFRDAADRQFLCNSQVPAGKTAIPPQICLSLYDWDVTAIVLNLAFVLLGVIAVISSAIVAYNSTQTNTGPETKGYLIVAAITWGAISGFHLEDTTKNIREATRQLNIAVVKYQNDMTYNVNSLIDDYASASKLTNSTVLTQLESDIDRTP